MSEPSLICLPMSAPTPIALCITDLDPGGAERALVQVVTRLDRGEWTPVVYCLGPRAELADVLEAAGIEVHCLNASRRGISVILRLSRLLKRQRPGILQTFLFHANFAGRLAGWMAGVPVVVSGIRVSERAREKEWHLWLDWLTKRLVTHHVAVSRSVSEFSSQSIRLSRDKVSVIPNGVDAAAFADAVPAVLSQFSIPSTASTLLFVGRLHPQKGLDELLGAMWELVEDDRRDVHLLIVGQGPERIRLEPQTRAGVLEKRVHWLGQRRDVASLMKSATLLVLPSLWEGMPNVVLEAMAAGLPVVATKVDGTAELITDGETGWLCGAGTEWPLEEALRDALDSPEARRDRAAKAQISVRAKFTWDAAAVAYSQLWRSLLDSKRPL
jgi:glycosyltransferase involved in cell wall biosynthesis